MNGNDDPSIVRERQGPAVSATDRRLSASIRVRFDEAGPSGLIRPSAFLRYAADLAWRHSEWRGYDRAWYASRGLAWLVRGIELSVTGRIEHGDDIEGSTEVVAFRKVLARRRSEFRGPDGGLAAVMLVDWAMTTVDGVATRIPATISAAFGLDSAGFDPIRVRPAPAHSAAFLELAVRPQELDPMAHVNNAVYLDWVDEAILAARGPAARGDEPMPASRRYRLEYLAAASPGQRVLAATWSEDGRWLCELSDARSREPILGALVEPIDSEQSAG